MKVMPTPQKGTLTLGCFYKITKVITRHPPSPPNSKCDNPPEEWTRLEIKHVYNETCTQLHNTSERDNHINESRTQNPQARQSAAGQQGIIEFQFDFCPFSSPEAAILLVTTKDQDLWQAPEHRISLRFTDSLSNLANLIG